MLTNQNKRILSRIIKFCLLVSSFAYLYYKLSISDIELMWQYTLNFLAKSSNLKYFLLALFLVLANWGIEALKWKKLIQKLEPISFLSGIKSVLTGVSISLITPNRAGEFAGKIFYLRKADRADAMLLSIVGSLSQVLITFCCGIFALYYYLIYLHSASIDPTLLFSLVAGTVLLSVFLFFNTKFIAQHWKHWNFIQKIIPYHPEKFDLTKNELLEIVLLSCIRFAVFSTQYYLLLCIFGLTLSMSQSFALIALYFFLISLIPTYALSELGIRGSVALSLFSPYGMAPASILASSLLLWIINLALPALLGSLFVYQLRFFQSKND